MKKSDPHMLLTGEKGVELVANDAELLRMTDALADAWEMRGYQQTAMRIKLAATGAGARMAKKAAE